MSKLSDLKSRIHALGDIQSILNAMRNLSLIEMNKVSRFLITQQNMAQTIGTALADFENSFGMAPRQAPQKELLCVLIGSERGFCGPFNEILLNRMEAESKSFPSVKLLAVGRKTALKLEDDPRLAAAIDGANSVEEIPRIISSLSEQLIAYSNYRWLFLHNDGGESRLETEATFPLEPHFPRNLKNLPYPPLVNVTPDVLFPQLLEQYLSSALYRIFYLSFMAENRERLRHMDGALRKLDKDLNHLSLKLNASRQEEITEELELILLNTNTSSGNR